MDKRIVINTGPLIALMRMEALEIPAKPYLDRALQTGIRYHPDLVRRFLEGLGE